MALRGWRWIGSVKNGGFVMEEMGAFVAEPNARAMMELPTANADTTLQQRFAWVSAGTGLPTHSRVPLGDQFGAFADQLREWAELDLATGVEGWPDDDWSDL